MSVRSYIKRADEYYQEINYNVSDFEALIGTSKDKSLKIQTPEGFCIYANPDANGESMGHTIDITGVLRFWYGTFIITKETNEVLQDMSETDLHSFAMAS